MKFDVQGYDPRVPKEVISPTPKVLRFRIYSLIFKASITHSAIQISFIV